MIFIVIPVFNRLPFTVDCLRSLRNQQYKDFHIIVVNDGSTDDTATYLEENFQEVTVLTGNGGLWWTGATNLGIHHAQLLSQSDNDYILTLNNDLVVKDDYLHCLLSVAKQHPAALIGSVSVHIETPDKVHFAGTKWSSTTAKYKAAINEKIHYAQLVNAFDQVETDLLPGRGILIPIGLYKKIGLYDDAAFPHYMADEDFSLRAKAINYRLIIATKAVVYNHVNETGLSQKKVGLQYYKDVFTSIKSPVNFQNRWNWAKRHSKIYPPFYFIIDMSRIIKGLLFK